ncbi:MAG TPA: hypothetical protein DCS83_05280 [Prevotella sp.]|nr:hypothetical protein [Prevotella sp.]
MQEFDKEIFRVLVEAGNEGLKTEKIAHHVFNSCNSIFHPIEYNDVHTYVTQFLLDSCRLSDSIIEKTRWGVYRINTERVEGQQLLLDFAPDNIVSEKIDCSSEKIEDGKENELFLDL